MEKDEKEKIIEVTNIPAKPKDGDVFLIKAFGISSFTHGIFKYPCKFIPHIPRWFIENYASTDTKKYGVIDPFMGSGTTLVEASLLGYPSYGIDIDPLSKLLSNVKTTPFYDREFSIIDQFISDYKITIKKPDQLKNKIEEFVPDRDLINYWFSESTIKDLALIRFLIQKNFTQFKNKKVKNFLEIVLASIIRKVSKADNQSPKPYISTKIKKDHVIVFDEFYKNLIKYIDSIKQFSDESKAEVKIIGFDARSVDKKSLYFNKVSLAMTSPPYINAFDYVRSLKLENFWLDGFSKQKLDELYDHQIGSEKVKTLKEVPAYGIKELDSVLAQIYLLDKKRAWITFKYFQAMTENLKSIHDSLQKGGYYCIVVGNSKIRGFDVDTASILLKIAKDVGYKKKLVFSYIIRNRYLRIPRSGRGGFIPKDYVLVFEK
ncbi:MAG: DNA methyltransferase [Candidatus Pacebacteria bacterium]|nr:DNA methyltransferase [Candidatus Paceibacterota bacterium]